MSLPGVVLAGILMAAPEGSRFSCRLEADAEGPPSSVRFTLCNEGDAPVAALRWYTPFEGFLGDILEVTADGRRIDYSGPMVKRAAPRRDDYLILEPRECRSVTIDVARGYEITAGTYSVSFARGLADASPPAKVPRPPAQHRPVAVRCEPLPLRVGR